MSSLTQDIVSFLTIKIPEDNYEEQRLVGVLKWLETPNARKVLTEEGRIKRRKEITEEFRRALIKKEMFRKCITHDRDELYT
jgi:hypothetical protein